MPKFSYKARTANGTAEHGVREADSARELTDSLRLQGLMVVNIQPVAERRHSWNPLGWLPIRQVLVETALTQLSVMLRSGMTLLEALQTIADQLGHPRLRQVMRDLAGRIQAGASMADAMECQRCFPPLAVALVRVGEASGTLDEVLAQAAITMERARLLRNDLISALVYPAVVLVATVGVTIFMVFVTLPRVEGLLKALGRKMPPMTQLLLEISWFLQTYLPSILVLLLLLLLGLITVWFWPPGRLALGRLVLRVPPIGHMLRLGATALFARVLSAMLHSGLNLIDALRAIQALFRNPHFVESLATARSALLDGGTLADSLDTRTAFLPMLGNMVGVGEASGALDEVLASVAQFSEIQLQRRIRLFSAMVGPITILLVGSIVGFVYMSFFLAMFATTGG